MFMMLMMAKELAISFASDVTWFDARSLYLLPSCEDFRKRLGRSEERVTLLTP